MEAAQLSMNDETRDQQIPSRWKCYCVFHRVFVVVLLKLILNLGLLESLILCLRFVIDAPNPGFIIGLTYSAIFIDVVDIVTGVIIIISICMKRQGIMELYYKYSTFIFGSLTIFCCVIMYLIFGYMGPMLVLLLMLSLIIYIFKLLGEARSSEAEE